MKNQQLRQSLRELYEKIEHTDCLDNASRRRLDLLAESIELKM